MKVLIGGQTFATQAEAKRHVVETAKKYVGRDITPESEHYSLFYDLWSRSPSFVDGYDLFAVGKKFSSVCIRALSRDGKSPVDWSLRNAVSGHFPNLWTQLTLAMRQAIRPQVVEYRNNHRSCSRCYSFVNIEVDHVKPFKELMQRFLSTHPAPAAYHYTSSGWVFRAENNDFERSWAEFHRAHAKLRLLCKECHQEFTLQALRQEQLREALESSDGSEDDRRRAEPQSREVEGDYCTAAELK